LSEKGEGGDRGDTKDLISEKGDAIWDRKGIRTRRRSGPGTDDQKTEKDPKTGRKTGRGRYLQETVLLKPKTAVGKSARGRPRRGKGFMGCTLIGRTHVRGDWWEKGSRMKVRRGYP